MAVVPFCFQSKSIIDKKRNYELLVRFLKDNNWLNTKGDKMVSLADSLSDESGICHVLLAVSVSA